MSLKGRLNSMSWPGYFYQFTGLHSFLTGLLPFFLPVILWSETQSLTVVAGFIALSGFSFLISLLVWEALRSSRYRRMVIACSFLAEAVLISTLVIEEGIHGLAHSSVVWMGLLNGIYGCFYWLSLRMLFIQDGKQQIEDASSRSGNRFGNFQLLVGVLLKFGILGGAFLLEGGYTGVLLLVSLLVSGFGFVGVFILSGARSSEAGLMGPKVSLRAIVGFQNPGFPRTVFFIDGLFLFLESYFWVLSLYIISHESFARLGVLVVGLAVILAVMFLVIKTRIDAADSHKVFVLATLLYGCSWWLRGSVDNQLSPVLLSIGVIGIAFMTSFFRMSFNKLFFDRIPGDQVALFVLAKSGYTQAGVAVLFGVLALVFNRTDFQGQDLQVLYWMSAPLSLIYLAYIWQASNAAQSNVLQKECHARNTHAQG